MSGRKKSSAAEGSKRKTLMHAEPPTSERHVANASVAVEYDVSVAAESVQVRNNMTKIGVDPHICA